MRQFARRWSLQAVLSLLALLAGLLASRPGSAQMLEPGAALEDAGLYFTAPLRWDQKDWLYFATTMAAVAVTHEFDDDIRDHFVDDPEAAIGVENDNGTRDALPTVALLAGTWAYAAMIGSQDGYYETGTMLEAGVLTAASTLLFKYSFGRERPYDTLDVDSWFAGGDSFPSGHASLSFAVGTVFAESGSDRYRWLRRILGYGVAGATSYVRVRDNAHWASDVVAGAALGFATAQFTMNRRDLNHRRSTTTVVPVEGGLMLSWSLPLR